MSAATLSPDIRTMLSAAVRAPSVLNTQPWKFHVAPDHVDLHADPDRLLHVTDPRGRQQTISCGAALYNLVLAARHVGNEAEIVHEPDPGQPTLLARVEWRHSASPSRTDEALYNAIDMRRTARFPYADMRLRAETVAHLEEEALDAGGLLRVLTTGEVREFLRLVEQADTRLRHNLRVRQEFAAWVGSPREGDDGLPDAALGMVDVSEHPVIRDFALGGHPQGRQATVGERLPNIAVISTYGDERADWLRAGIATQRVLLQITRLGMVASFLTQPLEEEGIRAWIRRGATFPQIAIRLGYGPTGPTTPRRPLEDVMV